MQSDYLRNWRNLQAFEQHEYRADYERRGDYLGHFSVPEYEATTALGMTIAARCRGLRCLDIGCGIVPTPNYMQPGPSFYGIDPFYGEHQRDFPFAQAIGEGLPFVSQSFGAALMMSSLDHAISPLEMLKEARRVLRVPGLLFLWIELRDSRDHAFVNWQKSGGLFNAFHQWAFTRESIRRLLYEAKFRIEKIHHVPGVFGKYPATQLITAWTA